MVILTDSEFLASVLPEGWRVLKARQGSKKASTFILSPEGRRFDSLQDMREFVSYQDDLVSFQNANCDSIADMLAMTRPLALRPHPTSSLLYQSSPMPAIQESSESSKLPESLQLTEHSKLKRKIKSLRNPFRNLLKTILKKNHSNTIMKQRKIHLQKVEGIVKKKRFRKVA